MGGEHGQTHLKAMNRTVCDGYLKFKKSLG